MTNNTQKLIYIFIFGGLYVICLLIFSLQFQDDNNAAVQIESDPSISYLNNSLYSSLGKIESRGQGARQSVESDTPFSEGGSLIIISIFGALKSLLSLPIIIYNIITGFIAETLGIPSLVLNIIAGVIAISISFAIWRTTRTGES